MNSRLVRGLLADLDDLRIHFLAGLVDDLLDAPGMDAAVGDELLERETCDLASDRIEARDDDSVRRVVDDHVDARSELEGADVPSLATDDTTLHLIIRERHRGHRALGRMLGGNALNGESDDLPRFAFGV